MLVSIFAPGPSSGLAREKEQADVARHFVIVDAPNDVHLSVDRSRVLFLHERTAGCLQVLPDEGLAEVVGRGVLRRPGVPGHDGGLVQLLSEKLDMLGIHRPPVDSYPVFPVTLLPVGRLVRRRLARGDPDDQDAPALHLFAGDSGDVPRDDAAAVAGDPPGGVLYLLGTQSSRRQVGPAVLLRDAQNHVAAPVPPEIVGERTDGLQDLVARHLRVPRRLELDAFGLDGPGVEQVVQVDSEVAHRLAGRGLSVPTVEAVGPASSEPNEARRRLAAVL